MEMDRCHLWLGKFHDRAEVDDYFRERVPYSDTSISRFAADQDKRFYDHDWVFTEFDATGDLDSILTTIRAPAGTRAAVLAAASAIGFWCNAVVAADEGEFNEPLSVAGPPRLEYIGCYPFWDQAPDAKSRSSADTG